MKMKFKRLKTSTAPIFFKGAIFVSIAVISTLSVADAPDLSERNARVLIEEKLNAPIKIPLGVFLIIGCNPNGNPLTSPSAYPVQRPLCIEKEENIKLWAQTGLIVQTRRTIYPTECTKKDPTHRSCLSLSGTELTLEASPTGKKLVDKADESNMIIPRSHCRITKLVENKSLTGVVGDFRTVSFTFDIEWSQYMADFSKVSGRTLDKSRNGTILLRWDKFKSDWLIEALDTANSQSNFTANNVLSSIVRLGIK